MKIYPLMLTPGIQASREKGLSRGTIKNPIVV